ncbi:Exopolysaccharide production protein exoY [Pseudorhizobium banfieldiae]|uniref:Exopolysaccharide production protein exoY n=1 Tax=Pseudorhizobium banfieldiae TaxID=1125847 RepID=L0NBJ4_9HYPH|nr:sugar transferase [Pseudorhizobium banfieldiae]CAD6602454.1 sugar transferase [arsenite-oxidising bacterium NT-25]CAD6607085.1 sugar transferase [Rhizobium sp. TCK]CCF18455.1 Exopolysaccharide production protein exoY [Pseudorhizobium banfieldiae]
MKTMSDAHRHLASYDKAIEGRREHVKASTAFGPRRRTLGLAKRLFDIVFALGALIFVAPLFGVIMLAILLLDGRPIFYRQVRIGRHGRSFNCLKFRTMVRDADLRLAELLDSCPKSQKQWLDAQKLSNDPRVNRLGRFLRKSSLDELPQLINILRGEMSIVGPRPIVHEEAVRYGRNLRLYLTTRPGLTGLWQVSGRNSLSYQERVQLDVRYIRTMSAWLDARIILKTIAIVVTGKGDH